MYLKIDLMDALIVTIVGAIISGLGFLTYRHPVKTRYIISPYLFGIVALCQFISMAYYNAKIEAYSKSSSIILRTKKIVPSQDTSIHNLANNINITSYQEQLRDSINNQVEAESKITRDNYTSITVYELIAFGVLFVLFIFSYVIVNIKKQNGA